MTTIYLIGATGAACTNDEGYAQALENIAGYRRCTEDEYNAKLLEIEVLDNTVVEEEMPTPVEKFEHGHQYVVVADYDYEPENPIFKLKTMCYHLKIGDRLKFEGPNLGYARFQTPDGRTVLLRPKTAFRVIGNLTANGEISPR